MPTKPHVLEFEVTVDRDRTAASALGGLYAFVEIEARYDVELEQASEPGIVNELVERAERGCFVGNSLTPKPRYRWTVNGEEVA